MTPSNGQTRAAQRSPTTQTPATACPIFVPGALQRELAIDSAIRWVLTTIVIVGLIAASVWGSEESAWQMLLIFGIIGVWFTVTASATRAAQEIPKITALLDRNLTGAEDLLAHALKRRHMPKAIRLLLYHRLAVLRMRQGRFAEAAVICQAVLAQNPQTPTRLTADTGSSRSKPTHLDMAWAPHRNTEGLRTSLLLMLAESCLRCQDPAGAYMGLQQLHRQRLRLLDLLQLLMLQTRYEIATRQRTALHRVDKKISMAELMPAPQCGAMHGLLATAAERNDQTNLADWLWRRAQLLCTTEQLDALGITAPFLQPKAPNSAATLGSALR